MAMGGFNADIARPEVAEWDEEIAAFLSAIGLEVI